MKKLIIALCAVFAISTAAFCEAGEHLDFSAGADCSFMLKPYAYVNAGGDYEFENGLRLGGGVRGKVNVLHKEYTVSDELNTEAWIYGMPYVLLGYKGFTVEGGFCFSRESLPEFWEVPFVRVGGEVAFAEAGPGTIGMEFGAEFWPSLYLVTPTGDSGSEQLGAGLGSVFGTLFNMVKLSVGAKYRLSL